MRLFERGDSPDGLRAKIFSVIVVLVIMGAAVVVSVVVDRLTGSASDRAQSLQNGENLCKVARVQAEYNEALAEAFALSARQNPDLDPRIVASVNHLVEVGDRMRIAAARCEPEAPEETLRRLEAIPGRGP